MVDKLNSTDRFVGGLENTDGELRASEAISAGDPVKYDGTSTGTKADVSVSDTEGEAIAGVALHAASGSGEPITVAQVGAEVRTNSSGSISPGNPLTAKGDGSVNVSTTDAHHVVGQAKTKSDSNEVVMLVGGGGGTDTT